MEQRTPPVLYHGTGEKYEGAIERERLIPMSRLYVHLSADSETVRKVGSRHGKPVIYHVNCQRMAADGYIFYLSANHVWLTKGVPARYLSKDGRQSE
jgi:putative RNA 2'-phosphotransferase